MCFYIIHNNIILATVSHTLTLWPWARVSRAILGILPSNNTSLSEQLINKHTHTHTYTYRLTRIPHHCGSFIIIVLLFFLSSSIRLIGLIVVMCVRRTFWTFFSSLIHSITALHTIIYTYYAYVIMIIITVSGGCCNGKVKK